MRMKKRKRKKKKGKNIEASVGRLTQFMHLL